MAWVAGPLCMVVVVASFVGIGVLGTRDVPGLISDPRIVDAIGKGCEDVRAAVGDHPVVGPPRQKAAAVRRQNVAVDSMLRRVESVGDARIDADRPTRRWIADWRRLVDARVQVAADLDQGRRTRFRVPRTADDEPINRRMGAAAELAGCSVPRALLRPLEGPTEDV